QAGHRVRHVDDGGEAVADLVLLIRIQVAVDRQAAAAGSRHPDRGDHADDLGSPVGPPDLDEPVVFVRQFQGVARGQPRQVDAGPPAPGIHVVHGHAGGIEAGAAAAVGKDDVELPPGGVKVVQGCAVDALLDALVEDPNAGDDALVIADLAGQPDPPADFQVLEVHAAAVHVAHLDPVVDVIGTAADPELGVAADPHPLDLADGFETARRDVVAGSPGADVDDLAVDHVGPGAHPGPQVVGRGEPLVHDDRDLPGEAVGAGAGPLPQGDPVIPHAGDRAAHDAVHRRQPVVVHEARDQRGHLGPGD